MSEIDIDLFEAEVEADNENAWEEFMNDREELELEEEDNYGTNN